MFRRIFLLLLPALLPIIIKASCPVSPEFWCSSPEAAYKCGVLEQCKKNEWSVETYPLVHIELYMESLCPDCKQFISNQLWPTWKEVSSIMNLTLIPYGNALEKRVDNKWEFECQHGKEECIGNLIETCAIDILKDVKVWFPFIQCIEASSVSSLEKASKLCARSNSIRNYDVILNCSKSQMGNDLMHRNALKTDALQPPHQYVPWIVLNGIHTDAIQNKASKNLRQLVCETWKGHKPRACEALNFRPLQMCFRKGRRM